MVTIEEILPIVLIYEEQGMTKATTDCLKAAGFTSWNYADREGVGSMSRAFNRAFMDAVQRNEDFEFSYVWFITNVTFPATMPAALLEAMKDESVAAVHPAFNSDHPHICGNGHPIEEVPFIEWTAPLIRIDALADVGLLDEQMPYVHFDLDWSYRASQKGWRLLVDARERLGHTYLWKKAPEKISELRRQLRDINHDRSVARMVEKWGHDWKKKLCPTGTCG